MRYVLVLLLLILSGCTVMNPRGIPHSLGSSCTSYECLLEQMDSLDTPGERFRFMEGYPDSNLLTMYKEGRLEIDTINPMWYILGVYGYATIYPGLYGEVYKCVIRYTEGLNWLILKHELAHCQGYMDVGILNHSWLSNDYTPEQQKILKAEGVTEWRQTEYYKELIDGRRITPEPRSNIHRGAYDNQ